MRRAAATLLRLPRGSTAALFDAARESAAASPSGVRCAGVASTSRSSSSWSALTSGAWQVRHAASSSARDDERRRAGAADATAAREWALMEEVPLRAAPMAGAPATIAAAAAPTTSHDEPRGWDGDGEASDDQRVMWRVAAPPPPPPPPPAAAPPTAVRPTPLRKPRAAAPPTPPPRALSAAAAANSVLQAAAATAASEDEEDEDDAEEVVAQATVAVRAYHVGGEIDFAALCRALPAAAEQHPGRDHVVIKGEDLTDDTVLLDAIGSGGEHTSGGGLLASSNNGRRRRRHAVAASTLPPPEAQRLVVVYRFGSVVFFGGRPAGDAGWVAAAQAHAKEPLPEPLTDTSTVLVRGALREWFTLEPDRIVVRALDVGNVRVISAILGQSVALDHYNRRVDAAIDTFTPILAEIARTGVSRQTQSNALLRLIGDNALLYTAVVTRLGLLDMTDTAWRNDRYFGLWASLRADYEIDRRFDALRGKLGPMLENAKFILEVREDKKSERSEMIIIALIAVEIVVNLLHHVL